MGKFEYNLQSQMALPLFYKKFNDINIFVEDSDRGHNEFYRTLLNRLIDGRYKIRRIFSLKGRKNVIAACKQYNNEKKVKAKRSLFIVDGDLDLICKKNKSSIPNLVALNVYCIENYLVDKKAMLEFIHDTDGTLSKKTIEEKVKYDKWIREMLDLVELFIVYAISHTNSLGNTFIPCTKIFTQKKKKTPVFLDKNKLKKEIKQLENQIKTKMPSKQFNAAKKELSHKWSKNETNVLKIVSGKKYLLPLVRHKINSIARNSSSDYSLKIRLAKNCSLARMRQLRKALTQTAQK